MSIDLEGTLREMQYSDRILFDSVNGVAGTIWPVGSANHPSSVITDTITLCARYNLTKIEVRGALTLAADMAAYQLIPVGDTTITPAANNCNVSVSEGALTVAGVTGGITNIYSDKMVPVTLPVSCNAGTINVYGDCHLTDNTAAGCTVNDYSTPNNILEVNTTVAGLNLYSGTGTSTEVGEDVYTITVTERSKIGFLAISMLNCNDGFAGPEITVRMYTLVNSVEEKFYEQIFTKGQTPGGGEFGGDPDLIVLVDSELRFNNYIRIEARSNYFLDTAVSIPIIVM
ncbi:MAG: hypothetical protein DRJ64_08695 [Thermoprotei archaeon]|nr:MAG: hypothetical protein DRJ64_08695 [Thermoprotei archaeon]